MYKNIFESEENAFRPQLSNNLVTVIRLDGKNITKNHKEYPLLEPLSFTWEIKNAGTKLVHSKKYKECFIYTCLDEISFIFPDSKDLLSEFDDGNAMYLAGIFLQEFHQNLKKDVFFGISVFQIRLQQILPYIKFRKKCCCDAAITYYAKEHLSIADYHKQEPSQIIKTLVDKGYKDDMVQRKKFFEGSFLTIKHPNKGKFSLTEKEIV